MLHNWTDKRVRALVAGLLAAPLATYLITQRPVEVVVETSAPFLVIAGLLVGIGTAIGSGCTSGHGVCGVARVSPRSFIATAVFLVTAMIVVAFMRHFLGGGA
ncbi:MAG: YeeE/YedE thiosulfate transporter family protein [Pseudomonadota bacterium]